MTKEMKATYKGMAAATIFVVVTAVDYRVTALLSLWFVMAVIFSALFMPKRRDQMVCDGCIHADEG